MPQFDYTTYQSQIFWLVVTFALLYMFLAGYVLPTIRSSMEERQQRIALRHEEVQRLNDECQEVLNLATQLRAKAKQEADAVRRAAADDAKDEYQRAMERARLDVEELVSEARAEIAEFRKQSEADFSNNVALLVEQLVKQTSPLRPTKAEIKAAVESHQASLRGGSDRV